MSNAFHTKDGAPIPKELRYSYPVDCIFLEYSHHWRLLQGENPLTHHHSWLCWDFLLLLDLPCKGIRQQLMALIRIPKFGKFLLVESGTLGVQFKESRIPLTIGNWNPSSTDKEFAIQYLGYRIHSGESGIQDYLGLPFMGRQMSLKSELQGWSPE